MHNPEDEVSSSSGTSNGSGIGSSSGGTVAAADVTDDDNSATGFGAATHYGTAWDSTNSVVRLADAGGCDATSTNCAELDESWTPQWSSLVSYWKMNEVSWNGPANEVVDSKGTHHGTGAGGVTTSTSAKMGNRAGSFDGVDDAISIDSSTVIVNNFSIGAWFYTPTGFSLAILGSRAPSDKSFDLKIQSTTTIHADIGNGTNWISVAADASVAMVANSWNHIAYIVSTTGYDIYLNGLWVGGGSYAADSPILADATHQLSIGSNGIGSEFFNGKVDEVAIWSTVLTATEIQTIYARQSAKYAGQFTSRVMNYGSSNAWDGLKWLTTLPFGKELTGDANSSGTITTSDSETHTDYPSLVGSTGSTNDDNLMSGLVGLWHMNETAGTTFSDSSGKGNTATIAAGTLNTDYGKLGNAIKFDGVTYATIPHTAALDLSSAWAISAWVKQVSTPAGGTYPTILTDGFGGAYVQYCLGYCSGATVFSAGTYYGGWHASPNYTLTNGEWTHAVGVYDGSDGTLKLYINGTLIGTTNAIAASLATDGVSKRIGRRWDAADYFNGSIDEISLWNRALHADEIKQLYRRGANRLKYQVRTCTSSDCSDDPTWLGPDNTNQSYFSELHNYAPYNYDVNNCSATNLILTGSPAMLFDCFTSALSNLTTQQYFQYRAILESDDTSTNCDYGSGATWCSPELKSVEVKP